MMNGLPNDSADKDIRPTNFVGKFYKNPLTVCILYIIYNIIEHEKDWKTIFQDTRLRII